MTNLVFFLQNSILLLPNGDLGSFILPQSSLLFQLGTPEGLDAVHGRAELALLHLHVLAQQIVLAEHLLELRLQVHDGVVAGLAQRVGHGGGHAHGRQVVLSEGDAVAGHAAAGDVGAAAHGRHPHAVREPPPGAAQGHGALGGVGAHVFVLAEVHGAGGGVGSVQGLDVLHGQGLAAGAGGGAARAAARAVGAPVAQAGRARQARGAARALRAGLGLAHGAGAAVHAGAAAAAGANTRAQSTGTESCSALRGLEVNLRPITAWNRSGCPSLKSRCCSGSYLYQ